MKETTILKCTVCGKEDKDIQYSLRLTKDKKSSWQSNPICPKCRQALIRDARAEGKFIPFFSLKASEREARKRNEQTRLNRPFLDKFARVLEEKAKSLPKKAKVTPLKAVN